MLGQIILQIVLIVLNAVFTCAEIAVIQANPAKIDKLAEEGNKKAKKLQKLSDNPTKFLATIQVAITLSGFIGAAFAADNFADRIIKLTNEAGLEEYSAILKPLAVIAVTLILSYITLVFGELVPKRAAMKNPENLAMNMAGMISIVQKFFTPLVWTLNASTNGVLRLMGINPQAEEETVTEEEILMMSDAGAESGTIDEDDNRIIKNIFEFDDLTAEQVCTHRTDVVMLWAEEDVETWEKTIHRTRHSLFPICGESIDNIIGILNAKDYFRLTDKSRENIMKNAVREPYFVHETMKADVLFAQMKKRGAHHFAVVVDEYGGTTGIITVTDLVEELVGEFDDDEMNTPEPVLKSVGENRWIVPGITDLGEVNEALEINLPTEEYDTFGGYVIDGLGEIPKDGLTAELDCDGLHIEVLKIHHHRVEICMVTKGHL